MSTMTVTVPDIGGAEDVEIIEINVAVGDSVEQEQDLLTTGERNTLSQAAD